MNHVKPANFAEMVAPNRDKAVGDYVRYRIRQWELAGQELQALAMAAEISPSSPSQVKRGMGVAAKTGAGYAVAFKLAKRNEPAKERYEKLQRVAYQWWLEQGQATSEWMNSDLGLKEAIQSVIHLNRATEEHLAAILADFRAERFKGRPTFFWIQTLLGELEFERQQTLPEAQRGSHPPAPGPIEQVVIPKPASGPKKWNEAQVIKYAAEADKIAAAKLEKKKRAKRTRQKAS